MDLGKKESAPEASPGTPAPALDRSARRKTLINASVTVASVLGIIVLLQFFIGPKLFGRIDLTDRKYHTLNDASKKAVTDLDDLTVRVYISEPLPESITLGNGQRVSLRGVAQAFRDKLEEYRAYSNGRMKIVYVTSDVREQAEKAKLQLFTSDQATVQQGRLELAQFALGATFHYRNVKEVLPLALNPDTYEFDVTRILLRLGDKYDKSQAMKQMLDKGKAIFEAVQSCHGAIASAAKKDEADDPTDAGLKGLIQAAEKVGEELERLRAAKPSFEAPCGEFGALMAKDGAALRAKNNEYIDIFLGRVDEFQQTYDAFVQRLGATEEREAMAALELKKVLELVYDDVDRDHDNLVNSPGNKRIGFVCGHGEFCPFPDPEPMVKPELGAILGQQNPIVKQMMDQAQQIEQNINQINQSINQNLFKRGGFDIARIDLREPVPSDVESLILYGPTYPLKPIELYHLDQFALAGKPVAVFAKNWDISLLNMQAPEDIAEPERYDYTAIAQSSSNIGEWLRHYGIELGQDLVAEPTNHEVILLSVMTERGRMRWQTQRAFPYPLLPTFEDLNQDNVLLQNLKSLSLPYTSTVRFTDAVKGAEGAEELVRTSPSAVIIGRSDVPQISILPPDTLPSLAGVAGRGPAPVAVALQTEARSYFEGKPKPAAPSEDDDGEEADPAAGGGDQDLRRKDSGSVRLLVVGSNLGLESLNAKEVLEGFDIAGLAQGNMELFGRIRIFGARLQNWQLRIQQVAELLQDNLRFMFNVLDWSIANEALVAVRSKGYESRPLEKLKEGRQSLVTYANIFGVPVLFLLFGGARHVLVRQRRRRLSA